MAFIARLVTACGCTRDQIISEELPVLRVVFQENLPPHWRDAYSLVIQIHRIREFERFRVVSSGEGAMSRIVEYRERVEPVRPSAPAPQAPYVRVVQTLPNGQRVRLYIVRHYFTMPGASEMTVEVAGATSQADTPLAPRGAPALTGVNPTPARTLHSPSVRQTVTEILEGESHNRQEHS